MAFVSKYQNIFNLCNLKKNPFNQPCSVFYNSVLFLETVNLKVKWRLTHFIFRSVLWSTTTVEEICDMQHIRLTVWRGREGNSREREKREKAKADVSI